MLISQKLKQENIAEYLLYMWQVEDLIRANHLNIDELEANYISRFHLPTAEHAEMKEWYENLIEMMRSEGVAEKGHIQINKNILVWLTDLHLQLLKSPKYPFYSATYYKALPLIVELRRKAGDEQTGELETCFNALYGLMMLRLQGRPVSEDTSRAMSTISQFIGMLSDYYKKDKAEPLEF
ncbi:MAG: DUF4924 family protein [Bacteroidaceae bacterium]|jgi:hypothetical protein|nr:DUF4924 family protein [Bacteroidaceae bacterium]